MFIFAKQLVDFTISNLEDFLRLGASATLPRPKLRVRVARN